MIDWAYIEKLHLSSLRPPGALPKVPARLVELIEAYGSIDPVVVRAGGDGRYEILSNAVTWLAAQRAGVDRVAVRILDDLDDAEAAEIVIAADGGYQADPIDEAEFFQTQIERLGGRKRYGATVKLAGVLGLPRAYISHSLRLLDLPLAVQELVRSGSLSAGHGRAIVALGDSGRQRRMAQKIVSERLSVRATEELVRSLKKGVANVPSPSVSAAVDPDLKRLEGKIGERLGCVVSIDKDHGQLVVHFHNNEVLDGVLERIGVSEL